MTDIQGVFAQQVAAMQRRAEGEVSSETAAQALTAAKQALDSGLPLVRAVVAASCVLDSKFATYEVAVRGPIMVRAMNMLIGADAVEPLTPARPPRAATLKGGGK